MSTNLIIGFSIMAAIIVGLLVIVIILSLKNNRKRLPNSYLEERTVHLSAEAADDEGTMPLNSMPSKKAGYVQEESTVELNNQYKVPRLSEDEKTGLLQSDYDYDDALSYKTSRGSTATGTLVPKAQIRYMDSGNRKVYKIDSDMVMIGRDVQTADCVVTEDNFVGREHALLMYRRGSFYIIDLDSKNGTFIEGERIRGIRKLSGNSKLKVGKTELDFICY